MLRNIASQRWRVYCWDRSTGAPKTGDAANISAKITIDDGASATTNDTAPDEIDATNEPGFYAFNLTQAETAGAKLTLGCKSSTSNIVVMACPPVVYTRPQYFSLEGIDSAGLVSSNVSKINSVSASSVTTINANVGTTQPHNFTGTGGSALVKTDMVDIAGAAVSTSTAQLGVNMVQLSGDATAADNAESFFDGTGYAGTNNVIPTVTTVGTLTTYTGNTPQTGDAYARLGAPAGASVSADVAAVKAETAAIVADTNELQTDWTNGGRLDLIIDAILADTAELQTDWVNGGRLDLLLDATLADTNELQTDWVNGGRLDLIVDAILVDTGTTLDGKIDALPTAANNFTAVATTQLTESYAADGAAPTIAQALFQIQQMLTEFVISGTTWTVKKLDGSTTAFVITLDDAVNPTSATRSA